MTCLSRVNNIRRGKTKQRLERCAISVSIYPPKRSPLTPVLRPFFPPFVLSQSISASVSISSPARRRVAVHPPIDHSIHTLFSSAMKSLGRYIFIALEDLLHDFSFARFASDGLERIASELEHVLQA